MRLRAIAIAVIVLVAGGIVLWPFARGLSFVMRAADLQDVVRRVASFSSQSVTESEIAIDAGVADARTPTRGRLYLPTAPRRFALLVSGLHAAGIDEPRLVNLARQLAASGIAVMTPAIPELEVFSITPAITDGIEAAALWLSRYPGVADRDGRIGLIGISFSGGLAIVAAGRPALRDKIAYVASIGGHDDLPRVLRYLCTGTAPMPSQRIGGNPNQTFVRSPHDYGVAVMLLGVADKLVPHEQVDALRAVVRRFLWASSLDSMDKPRSEREFAALRDVPRTLPEPSRTLVTYLNNRDVIHLGARLLPYVSAYGGDASLSVSRSPRPRAPVFLLHGSDDNVIPSVESEYLADDLRGNAPVRLLLSGLISHASADRAVHVADIIALANFWGDLLGR